MVYFLRFVMHVLQLRLLCLNWVVESIKPGHILLTNQMTVHCHAGSLEIALTALAILMKEGLL